MVSERWILKMKDLNHVWPEEVYAGLEETVIGGRKVCTYKGMPDSLYHALQRTAERCPDRSALVDDDGSTYSYREFQKMVDLFADYLYEVKKVRKGCHVGMLLGNRIEFCVAYLALCRLGAVVVSLPGKYQKPELLLLVEKADLFALICEKKYAEWFSGYRQIDVVVCAEDCRQYGFADVLKGYTAKEMMAPVGRPEDPVILMFTSGTTSMSKGVLLKNYNVMQSVEAYQKVLQVTENDRSLVATPMYHITGLVCILALFLKIGGTLYLQKKVDPDRMLRCMIINKITFYHASPTVFSLLLDKRAEYPEVPDLRSFACGSGNMTPENIRRLHEWMPQAQFHTVFGMTETSGAGTIFPGGAADSPYIGSSGIPMPDLRVEIRNEEGTELKTGEVGEICLKGSFVLERYYNYETDAVTEDGWLKTGDLGYLNEAGYLYVVDRKKDMINRGGEKICSYDVENELSHLPGVMEAAVVAVPDEKYMEVPAAMLRIEKDSGWNGSRIQEALKSRMARYKIPVVYAFVDEIPKTCNGKVDKRTIRKQMEEQYGKRCE